jgi:mono/diheme cytochrome c family protein
VIGSIRPAHARFRQAAVAASACALVFAGLAAGAWWWRTRHAGPVQRGWAVADAHGCFGCHGPGGAGAAVERADADVQAVVAVPSFRKDDLDAYAQTDAEIREWILDGMPRRVRATSGEADAGEAALVVMPAFRGVLSDAEVDDLVAYVRAVGDRPAPNEARAAAGREAAERLGCFTCHGPQGRGAVRNPGSLKGYIPPWDGPDFAELARDEAELAEWILDGRPRRLAEDRLARFFLDRQVIRMPAYRGRISEGDLQAIGHYVRWLRTAH